MPTSFVALLSALICSLPLAACGDASDTSTTTRTATVPSGKLGTQLGARPGTHDGPCPVPRGLASLNVAQLSCSEAENLAAHVRDRGPFWLHSYTCNVTKSSARCINKANPDMGFFAEW